MSGPDVTQWKKWLEHSPGTQCDSLLSAEVLGPDWNLISTILCSWIAGGWCWRRTGIQVRVLAKRLPEQKPLCLVNYWKLSRCCSSCQWFKDGSHTTDQREFNHPGVCRWHESHNRKNTELVWRTCLWRSMLKTLTWRSAQDRTVDDFLVTLNHYSTTVLMSSVIYQCDIWKPSVFFHSVTLLIG